MLHFSWDKNPQQKLSVFVTVFEGECLGLSLRAEIAQKTRRVRVCPPPSEPPGVPVLVEVGALGPDSLGLSLALPLTAWPGALHGHTHRANSAAGTIPVLLGCQRD